MPCDMQQSREELTAIGMLDEEITLMEKRIERARMVAEERGLENGKPLIEIANDIEKAERDEREIAHDRFHRRIVDESKTFFDSLKNSLHHAHEAAKVRVNG